MADVLEQSSVGGTRNPTDDGHEAVAGTSQNRTRESDTNVGNEVAKEQVDGSVPLIVEIKGYFKDPYMSIWDCTIGQVLRSDTFHFTHCRISSKDSQLEWLTLHIYGPSTYYYPASASRQTEPPGYQSFKKPMEHVFQKLVYDKDSNGWKSELAITELEQLYEEGEGCALTADCNLIDFSKFITLRHGFLNGMANGRGRATLHNLLDLLKSFIRIKKPHFLTIFNIGGGSALGHGKVRFVVESNSIAKGRQPKKRKRNSSDLSSTGSKSPAGQYFLPVSSPESVPGSGKYHGYNTPMSPESDYDAANEGQVQVSSRIRGDLQKYFVPDVALEAWSKGTWMPFSELITVSVKHGKLDNQAVRQLLCGMLPVVLKHNIAVGLLINACEAYRIKLVKLNGKITESGLKYDFVSLTPDEVCAYFDVEKFNMMCVQIINDCQQIYDYLMK